MFSFAAAVFGCRLIEKKRWFDECRRRRWSGKHDEQSEGLYLMSAIFVFLR
jgi:hypothetical protein